MTDDDCPTYDASCYDEYRPMPRRCPICSVSIAEKRADASSCGAPRCRKAVYRAKLVTVAVAIEPLAAIELDSDDDVSADVLWCFADDAQRYAQVGHGGSVKRRAARKAATKAATDAARRRLYDIIESSH